MDINEYREEFIEELRASAAIDNTDTDDEFLQHVLELLEELGEFPDPVLYYFGKKGKYNRIMQFNAYGYDEADSSIILLISFFKDTFKQSTLTNSQIDMLYKRMVAFIDEVYTGDLSEYCDSSNEILKIGREFKKRLDLQKNNSDPILKFKFYIITNSVLSNQVKNIKRDALFERPVELNIWTLERFYDLAQSNKNEPIIIDTKNYGLCGIPFLKAEMGDTNDYDAYLAMVPGKFLADIYLQYGSRLLEGNIRAFLSVRGKVNKGIRKTIVQEPKKFFTYNNGIATTAESVTFENLDNGRKIVKITNFQIINGGQTTASLASAIINKDNIELKGIYVPMKLTVVKPSGSEEEQEEKYNDMIEKISKCANCQNPVSDADFFSNSPYHILMEKMSKKYMAPPVKGVPHPTVWYYERSRGKWEQEQMKMSKSEREKFKKKYPKQQRVTKEKWAKCLNTLNCLPHVVSKGSANNMKEFAAAIEQLYKKSKDQFNEVYYKKAVCSVIIFDKVDILVNRQPWYPKGGNKAQIVPYAISKIISCIPKGKYINISLIWQNQDLYPSFAREIEIVSKMTHDFLADSHGVIVREYAKDKKTWEKFLTVPYELTDNFTRELVELTEIKSDEISARKDQKLTNDITAEIEVFNMGADYWNELYSKVIDKRILNEKELSILSVAANMDKGNIPTSAQAKRIIEIHLKLKEEGICI